MQYRHSTFTETHTETERDWSGQGNTEEDGHDAGAGRVRYVRSK